MIDEDEMEPTYQCRQGPSIAQPDKTDASCKFFRTQLGSHKRVRREDAEAPHQDTSNISTIIDTTASEAADEAESLLALLRVSPKQLHQDFTTMLPSISSLLPDSGLGDDREGEVKDTEDEDEDDTRVSEAQELQDLLQRVERKDAKGLP